MRVAWNCLASWRLLPQSVPNQAAIFLSKHLYTVKVRSLKGCGLNIAMSPYEYMPLGALRGEIRLVKLLPGVFRDGIRIEVFHAKLYVGSHSYSGSSDEDISDIGSPNPPLSDLDRSGEEASDGIAFAGGEPTKL